MRRILHIVGSMQRAGAETLLMNLYRGLDRENFQFDFLYFGDEECDYDAEILSLGGKIYRIPSSSKNRFMRVINRFFDFSKLLKELSDHQIIHSHINLNGAFFLWIAAHYGKKVRVSHSHISKGSKKPIARLYRLITCTIIKKSANIYIACGHAAGSYLYPSISKENVIVFPNSINIRNFQKESNNSDYLKDQLKIPSQKKVITQIGRFTYQKNYEFTINFVEYLIKKNEQIYFVFVGTGPLERELKSLVSKKGLNDYIYFYGVSTEIPKILHSSDVFFMPSNLEGFPVVLVEAQACGIPCLLSTNISEEVDMGLDLVKFLDLNSGYSSWHNSLQDSFGKRSNDFNHIFNVMKVQNFDARSSVKKLQDIYSQHLQ